MNTEILRHIDLSVLSGTAEPSDAERACSFARSNGCRSVIVNPCFITLCRKQLAGSDIKCASTTSYPLGTDLLAVTLYAAQQSILAGCSEIVLTLNTGQVLSGEPELTAREIQLVYASIDAPLGVYIDASPLTEARLTETAKIAVESGAAYIVLHCSDVSGAPDLVRLIADTTGNLARVRIQAPFQSVSEMHDLLKAGCDGLVIDTADAKTLLG